MSKLLILLFLILTAVLPSSVTALLPKNSWCLPTSPEDYECTDVAMPEDDKEGIQNLTVGGVYQQVEGSDAEKKETLSTIVRMGLYLRDLKKQHPDIAQKCKNTHELCSFWSSVGKCDTNRIYMLRNCAPACRFCLLAHTNMGIYVDP